MITCKDIKVWVHVIVISLSSNLAHHPRILFLDVGVTAAAEPCSHAWHTVAQVRGQLYGTQIISLYCHGYRTTAPKDGWRHYRSWGGQYSAHLTKVRETGGSTQATKSISFNTVFYCDQVAIIFRHLLYF